MKSRIRGLTDSARTAPLEIEEGLNRQRANQPQYESPGGALLRFDPERMGCGRHFDKLTVTKDALLFDELEITIR